MIPVRLQIQGFLSYRDPVDIDFEGVTATAITGDNGSGKTSLVEAIAWAMFGEGRGRGPDDFVNASSTMARVEFTFALGGRLLTVRRERDRHGKGKSFLGLFELKGGLDHWRKTEGGPDDIDVWEPIGGDHIVEVQASIEDLVGLTYDQWITTSYIAQGRADAFTRLTPAGRKDLLAQILDLDRFRIAERFAKAAADRATGELGGLDRILGDTDALIDGEPAVQDHLQGAKARLDDATKRAVVLRADLDDLQAREAAARATADVADRLDADRIRIGRALTEAVDASARIPGLEDRESAEVKALASAKNDVDVAIKTNANIDAELKRLDAVMGVLQDQIAEGTARVDALGREQSVCPTCGSPLTQFARESLLMDAQATVRNRRDEYAAASAVAENLSGERVDEFVVRQRVAKADATLADVRADLMEARSLADREQDLKEDLVDVETRLAAAQKDAGPDLVDDIQRTRDALADVNGDRDAWSQTIGALEAKMGLIAEAKRERDALAGRRSGLIQAIGDYGTLREAFGDAGVPALIIEAAVPAVEAEANQILQKLAPRFTVAFAFQKALKTGGIRETLDVVVADDVSERPLDALSGGERQAVDLAIRIGLGRMVAHRRSRRIQSLFLDEAFTALDAGRRQSTVEVIHGLVGEFDQVWFVTHDRDMAAVFPRTIQVELVGGTSVVSMEGAA